MQKKADMIRKKIAKNLNAVQKRRELTQNYEWYNLL